MTLKLVDSGDDFSSACGNISHLQQSSPPRQPNIPSNLNDHFVIYNFLFYIELIGLLEVHNSNPDVMATSGLKPNSVLITSLALVKMA